MMMMTTTAEAERFPIVQAGDAEDVVLALETGRALWGQGDPREAVRWLRRAAEHAEESGNDLRALSLARVAADLTTLMQSPQTVPVPARHDEFADQTEMSAGPPQASSAPPRLPPLPEIPTASRRPPAPSTLARSSPSAAPKPPTPSRSAVAPKPAPGNGAHAGNGAHTGNGARTPSLPPARTSALPSRSSVTPPVPTASRPAGTRPTAATTAESPVLQLAKAKRRGAVRVAVSRADSAALRVDILEEGQTAPAGATEALLVPLDPSADLLNLR